MGPLAALFKFIEHLWVNLSVHDWLIGAWWVGVALLTIVVAFNWSDPDLYRGRGDWSEIWLITCWFGLVGGAVVGLLWPVLVTLIMVASILLPIAAITAVVYWLRLPRAKRRYVESKLEGSNA